MKPERWQQIDELLQSALAQAPAERSGFLAQACVGDEPLRREVESLLASHELSENFLGAHVSHARTDIYSLGIVLYEMLAGRAPFEGATESDATILKEEPPPLSRYAPEVPAELEWIVTKALAKDKGERYQVVEDLLIDLKNLNQDLELQATIGLGLYKLVNRFASLPAASSSPQIESHAVLPLKSLSKDPNDDVPTGEKRGGGSET